MSSKALSLLFLLIVVVNIPIYMFYYKGKAEKNPIQIGNIFAKLSLGHIGSNHIECGEIDLNSTDLLPK